MYAHIQYSEVVPAVAVTLDLTMQHVRSHVAVVTDSTADITVMT